MHKTLFFVAGKVALVLTLFGSVAHAGNIYFEPGIGGGTGSLDVTNTSTESLGTTSPSLHLKMGSFTDYVYILADAKLSYLTLSKDSIDPTWLNSVGLALAFDWNIPVRISLGVDLYNSATVTSGSASAKLSGLGSRIGLAYYLSPKLIVNVESHTADLTGVGSLTSKYSTFTVSIGFPMAVDYPEESWRIRQGSKLR